MSFEIIGTAVPANANGLRVALGGGGIPITTFSAGICLGLWFKAGSGYLRGLSLESNEDGARPIARVGTYPATRSAYGQISRASGIMHQAYHFDSDYPDGTGEPDNSGWFIDWMFWGPTPNGDLGNMRAGYNTEAGSLCDNGDLTDFTTAGGPPNILTISLGVQKDYVGGVTDEFSTTDHKLACPFIAKRVPTTGVGGEIERLAGGEHPADVFGADIVDYWDKNSKTSAINGWTFSDVLNAVTINTTDNPPVADPVGGGGPTADVDEINGIATASVSAINGIAKASVAEILGLAI